MSLFIEEIIKTYNEGMIKTSFAKQVVKDIVFTSLTNSNRFNGITKKPYSTMLHSYAVGNLASDFALIYNNFSKKERNWVKLMGYMHDMGETVVGDVVYPLKTGQYKDDVEEFSKIEKAFLYWLGEEIFEIPNFQTKYEKYYPIVKKADEYLGVLELIGISKDSVFFDSEKLFEDTNLLHWNITQFGFSWEVDGLIEKCLKPEVNNE